MKKMFSIDLAAFAVAVFCTAFAAGLAAWLYNIRWQVIAAAPGISGYEIFFGMFIVAIGIPIYKGIQFLRSLRSRQRMHSRHV